MAENVLETIMIGLVNAGIKKVCVSYDGGGDEGSIEAIKISTNSDTDLMTSKDGLVMQLI